MICKHAGMFCIQKCAFCTLYSTHGYKSLTHTTTHLLLSGRDFYPCVKNFTQWAQILPCLLNLSRLPMENGHIKFGWVNGNCVNGGIPDVIYNNYTIPTA